MTPPASASSGAARPRDWTLWLLLGAIFAAWWFGSGGLLRSSHWAHYIYLADAFLNGHLHLVHVPNDAGDMARIGDKLYVVFGPFPALLLMPLVPFLQRGTPDVLVLSLTALAGAWAFHGLLATLHGSRDRTLLACATLTFALGTAMHYGAPMGNVWLHAQITATALQVFALLAAANGRAWTTGVLLGLTVLTRSTTTLALPFAAWLLWTREEREGGEPAKGRPWLPLALALLVPVGLAAALHGAYNWARFGSPLDAGYHYILMGPEFEALVKQYGRFSLHFLPQNLYGWLLRPPIWQNGYFHPDPHGMSLLLTTPYLLLALWPRKWSRLEVFALVSFALISLPSLLYYNDGWVHFGQRFALDGIALGLIAASHGAQRAPKALVIALTAWGVVVGAWGLQWFAGNFLH
ncbi:MAG: hypothetical protein IT348_05975 [Candidatus Eisenbacteria bacterium]|nr:hypothetical protein [Candidatus Eisenbacteria bacterium]